MLWKKAVAAVHQIYLGVPPEKFTYKGKEYTPKSFFELYRFEAFGLCLIDFFIRIIRSIPSSR